MHKIAYLSDRRRNRGLGTSEVAPVETHFLVGQRTPGGVRCWTPYGIFTAESIEEAKAEAAPDLRNSPALARSLDLRAEPVKAGDWVRLVDGRVAVLAELGSFHSWVMMSTVNADGTRATPVGVATARIAEVLAEPRDGLGHMALPADRLSICRADNGVLVHFPRLVGCPRCKAVLEAQR